MLRFYFKDTQEKLDSMSVNDWVENYDMLVYAIEFDSRRSAGEKKDLPNFPM